MDRAPVQNCRDFPVVPEQTEAGERQEAIAAQAAETESSDTVSTQKAVTSDAASLLFTEKHITSDLTLPTIGASIPDPDPCDRSPDSSDPHSGAGKEESRSDPAGDHVHRNDISRDRSTDSGRDPAIG